MLYASKKKSQTFTIAVALTIVILSVAFNFGFNPNFIKTLKFDIKQSLETYDFGVSNIRLGISDTSKKNFGFKNILYYLNTKFDGKDNNRPEIKFHLNNKNYLTILEDRSFALDKKILVQSRWVPAKIEYKGKLYKANVRLKGDNHDHWFSKKRMSLKVKLKEGSILGQSEFSVHKPYSRDYPSEPIFQDTLESFGNLTANHQIVNVFFNGDHWGLMDMQESFNNKIFLEKEKRKNSLVFKFGNEEKWEINKKYPNLKELEQYLLGDYKLDTKLYSEKEHIKTYKNRELYSYVVNSKKNNLNEILDEEKFINAFILSKAWNNSHTLFPWNTKFYLNPYTLLLEPITSDASFPSRIKDNNPNEFRQFKGPFDDLLNNENFLKQLKDKFSNLNIEDLKNKIQTYQKHYSKDFPLDNDFNLNIIFENLDYLINDFNFLQENSGETISTNFSDFSGFNQLKKIVKEVVYAEHFTNGKIKIYNRTPFDLEIKEIIHQNSNEKQSVSLKIKANTLDKYIPYEINSNFKGIQDDNLKLVIELDGQKIEQKIDLSLIDKKELKNPLQMSSNQKLISEMGFKINNKEIVAPAKEIIINAPLVIEGNLIVKSGTNFIFANDSYLIVKGSIDIRGSIDNPVKFIAMNDSWKGLYVLSNYSKSHVNNAIFSSVSNLSDGLLQLSGALNFYKSNITISNTLIQNITAEDALNTVHSNVKISNLSIKNTVSDGYDSDFSKGEIKNSHFESIGGDALDFSGVDFKISNTKLINVDGKGISAGEMSKVIGDDIFANNCGVSFVSKDGSNLKIINSKSVNPKNYAAMSYTKKDFYPKKTNLNIINSENISPMNSISQFESNLSINGKTVQPSDLNVKYLYNQGFMKK